MDINEIFDTVSLWELLKGKSKPIVLYGMGDGADKILNVCKELGIEISGVFASDDFVRGQSFRGFTVKKYADFKQQFDSFIILVAFASRLPEIIERIKALSLENELYIPDVPVYGSTLFTPKFVADNKEKILRVYSLLRDEQSKRVFYGNCMFKLTGKSEYLFTCETTVDESYDKLVKPTKNGVYVDVGAFNGDTIREYISHSEGYDKIFAFEPDEKNYARLLKNLEAERIASVSAFKLAAWDKDETLVFSARSGRNSTQSISGTRNKLLEVQAKRIDDIINEKVDYIKVDAEGSEKKVLLGMSGLIRRFHPTLNLALYHRSEDIFDIPLELCKITDEYSFYMRHFPYFPFWDTNLYALKQ